MKFLAILSMITFLYLPSSYAQDEEVATETTETVEARDLEEGAKIFKTRCTICHKMDSRLIGPPLKGVTERLDEEYLVKFIRNSQEVIKSGDPYAVELYTEYNELEMISNPDLTDDQIKNILAYIDPPVVEGEAVADETAIESTTEVEDKTALKEVKSYGNSIAWKRYFNYFLPPLVLSIFVVLFMNMSAIIDGLGGGKHA